MTKKIFITLAVFFTCQVLSAQTAGDVLENGVPIKRGKKIFLHYVNGQLNYDAIRSLIDDSHPPDYTPLEDSTIFLVRKNAVNLYITPPLNPLNFSTALDIKAIPDPIDEAAVAGLASIIEVFNSVKPAPGPSHARVTACDSLFKIVENNIKDIKNKLEDKNNQKAEINENFNLLKSLSFKNEKGTIDSLVLIKKNIDEIKEYFSAVERKIQETKSSVKNYSCGTNDVLFTVTYVLTNILNELSAIESELKKRVENITRVYDLVAKTQKEASTSETGLRWTLELQTIPSAKGKIHLSTITIKESGFHLSDKQEIVSTAAKDVLKKTIRVRKFQPFIPEVSVGTAYTFFKYNTYGTTADSAGKQTNNVYVASPTENLIKNVSITTMINFNYFLPNSFIHPFYQIGVGFSAKMPILITGFGIRSNINGIKRIAIAGGIAMTWVKELTELKVGDKISGTDDIDKDLKFQFASPKPYIGIQYNF